jgi:predicted nucleic-acid-binding Zn-ribbon protein
MKTVKITAAFALLLETDSWVIVNEDCAVGSYKSRTLAREAKATGLAGSVKNKSEIEFEIIDQQVPAKKTALDLLAALEAAEAAKKEVNLDDFAINEEGHACCPKCGSTELYQGEAENSNASMGRIINEDTVGGCHQCDWSFNHSAKKSSTPITHVSTIENPCKTVWGIAIDMKAANPLVKRGAVLAECVKQGIAYYTARTQYQAWLSVCKEEEATRLANEAKSK